MTGPSPLLFQCVFYDVKRTTKQKMARRHNKEGGNHLDQESNRQTTMEDIDGGLHPAVDRQSLGER